MGFFMDWILTITSFKPRIMIQWAGPRFTSGIHKCGSCGNRFTHLGMVYGMGVTTLCSGTMGHHLWGTIYGAPHGCKVWMVMMPKFRFESLKLRQKWTPGLDTSFQVMYHMADMKTIESQVSKITWQYGWSAWNGMQMFAAKLYISKTYKSR